jgi:hypothetical protein
MTDIDKEKDKYIDKTDVIFNLPISYLQDKQPIAEHIKTDLELIGEKSLYETVFQPTTTFGKQTIPLWSQYYTANKEFIKDSQLLLNNVISEAAGAAGLGEAGSSEAGVRTIWKDIKEETGFIEKYHYMEWKRFKEFNNSSSFLQLLSLYNMTSPIIFLAIPILFLILPFIILKIQRIPISLSKYFEVLKVVFRQHQLGQLFTIGSATWDKMVYIIASLGFYVLQVYQNVTSCVKYYHNMKKIHLHLFTMREYAKNTIEKMSLLSTLCCDLKTYQPFLTDMTQHKDVLQEMEEEFNKIEPNGFSLKKVKQIGHVMKCFYQLYNKTEYHEALEYSFGLNGYLDNLHGLGKRLRENQVNTCKILSNDNNKNKDKKNKDNKNKDKKDNKTSFNDAYFPTLVDSEPVKNSYTLDKHIIITGPNAAGKTTLLKTTIFNIILSQQTGVGFYKKANINLYDHIHCYINIPDTSERDSLFQAEARRCKEILDKVNNNNNKERHLCVFDELYSGTNPYEAVGSAYAFLSYLNKFTNVNFVLTTHYLELCKCLEKHRGINNYHMDVEDRIDNDLRYTYKLKKKISTIKGGVKVLKDLDYPKEIIDNAMSIIGGTV